MRWLCHIFGRLHRGSNECSSAMRYTHALRDPRSLGASAAETSASASFIFLSDDQVVVFVFVFFYKAKKVDHPFFVFSVEARAPIHHEAPS